MASPLAKRLEKLEQLVAARTAGPKAVRRVVVDTANELPTEGPDELLICRVMVTPPERPEDASLPETAQTVSPRIERGDRTSLQIDRFHRQIRMPKVGVA